MAKDLSLDDVVRKAKIDEQAASGIDHFRKPQTISAGTDVNKISDSAVRKKFNPKKSSFTHFRQNPVRKSNSTASTAAASVPASAEVICYRCAKPGHKAPMCHFRNATCSKCHRFRHIAAACGRTRLFSHPNYTNLN